MAPTTSSTRSRRRRHPAWATLWSSTRSALAAGDRTRRRSTSPLLRDSDESVIATATIDEMFEGPSDRVHGGVVAVVCDELMGAANRSTGRLAVTTELTVNLRAVAPIDTSLTFRAWIDQVDGQQITIPAACP